MGEFFETYLLLIKSPKWQERLEACKALGESNNPRAVEPLIGVLNDYKRVRRAACITVGKLGDLCKRFWQSDQ